MAYKPNDMWCFKFRVCLRFYSLFASHVICGKLDLFFHMHKFYFTLFLTICIIGAMLHCCVGSFLFYFTFAALFRLGFFLLFLSVFVCAFFYVFFPLLHSFYSPLAFQSFVSNSLCSLEPCLALRSLFTRQLFILSVSVTAHVDALIT